MAQHKYAVVRFTPDRTTNPSARGAYTIVKTLPEPGGVPQYHVKAKIDGESAWFAKSSSIDSRA
jgi:hypothetical protein